MRTLVSRIASTLAARENCRRTGNAEWEAKHSETLAAYAEILPSGSGWDNGTSIDENSTPNRIILSGSFHHMNDGGMYDGWTDHTIIVTPDLAHGFNMRITGRNRNDIKDYLADMFHEAMTAEAPIPVNA